MKKYFFLILFIGITFCNSLYSQWVPVGAKWTYTKTFNMSSNIDTFTIRSIGDTIIQNKSCKILMKNGFVCDRRPLREFMYEDNGKVFFYDDSRKSFQMLYNFNANVGDSTVIFPGDYPSNDYIATIIDLVSTITINSLILKKTFRSSFIFI